MSLSVTKFLLEDSSVTEVEGTVIVYKFRHKDFTILEASRKVRLTLNQSLVRRSFSMVKSGFVPLDHVMEID